MSQLDIDRLVGQLDEAYPIANASCDILVSHRADAKTVHTLIKTIDGNSGCVRELAFQTLRRFGRYAKPGLPALLDMARSEAFKVRIPALAVIATMGAETWPAIQPILDEKLTPLTRSALLGLMGQMRPPWEDIRPFVLKQLSDDSVWVRVNAAGVIVKKQPHDPATRSLLWSMVREDKDMQFVPFAARALVACERSECDKLLSFLPNCASERRAAILLGLDSCGAAAQEALLEALNDPDPRVRRGALLTIGRIDRSGWDAPLQLVELTRDQNADVRAAACLVIRVCGPDYSMNSVRSVVARLRDSASSVRCAAAFCLGSVPRLDAKALAELVNALADEDGMVALQAAQSLGRAGSDALFAVPKLLDCAERHRHSPLPTLEEACCAEAVWNNASFGSSRGALIPSLARVSGTRGLTYTDAVEAFGPSSVQPMIDWFQKGSSETKRAIVRRVMLGIGDDAMVVLDAHIETMDTEGRDDLVKLRDEVARALAVQNAYEAWRDAETAPNADR